MLGPIFGSHVQRIGVLRTLGGGLPIYLCIPLLILAHMTIAVVLYQWYLRPLLGTARIRWADYVVVDRHRISELTWFDKLNCMFCSYANGLITMINKELDNAAEASGPMAPWKRPILGMLAVLYSPAYVITELGLQVIYNLLVSRPLGLQRVSIAQASDILRKGHYASSHGLIFRTWLRLMKSANLRFAMGLEQIESSWCPLRHFERREGIVYPEHHKKFFGPGEIEAMRIVLSTTGTISDRKPTW